MLSLVTLLAISVPLPQDPAPPLPEASKAPVEGADEAVSSLARACGPLAEAKSYRFTMTTESDGGRSGFGGGAAPVEGTVVKGKPMHLRADAGEMFVLGERLAIRDEDGTWTAPPPREAGGERARRGARGGDDEERPRRGIRGGPDRMLRSFRAPHTLVTNVERFVAEVVRREAEDGGTVFSGVLNEEALELLGGGPFGGRGGRGAGGGDAGDGGLERTGTFSVAVDAQGALTRLSYSIRSRGTFGERAFDRARTTTFTVRDLETAEVEVPPEAAKVLEEDAEAPDEGDAPPTREF